jgi:hypothetical protein
MKFGLLIATMLTTVHAAAVGQSDHDFAAGLRYYEATDFGKAAARFAAVCNTDRNPEACYLTGIAYERLADIRIPFGCRTAAKAHPFFAKAMDLAPHQPAYRDALYNFLLDHAGCSRAALAEARSMLSATPQSDPGYPLMRSRLAEAAQWNSAFGTRLSNFFLAVPRASYRISASSGAFLTKRVDAREKPPVKMSSPPAPREMTSSGGPKPTDE